MQFRIISELFIYSIRKFRASPKIFSVVKLKNQSKQAEVQEQSGHKRTFCTNNDNNAPFVGP